MCEGVKMSGWAGFSEEELQRMQQKDLGVSSTAARGRKPASSNRSRQQLQREKALLSAVQRSTRTGLPELQPEQQLSKPTVVEPPRQKEHEPPRPEHSEAVKESEETPVLKELERQEAEVREKSRLELLQLEQKVMEEQNKRKKALLAKAIAEKSKQTQAEAVKLKRIQRDLQALDAMVSNDIGILRARIEDASWEYSTARKRFDKAEAEYVSAKMALHRRAEVKEQLTEHLCAIIQQNELRKSTKLEELMLQLQVQAIQDEEESQATQEHGERESRATQEQGESRATQDQGESCAIQDREDSRDTLTEENRSPSTNTGCEVTAHEGREQTETPALQEEQSEAVPG